MLGGPTTIISASKCISHEKSIDIQTKKQTNLENYLSQPSIEIRSQRVLSSTRSALLRELRSSCLLHNVAFTLRTCKHSKLSSATIQRICCLHSKQTRLNHPPVYWNVPEDTKIDANTFIVFIAICTAWKTVLEDGVNYSQASAQTSDKQASKATNASSSNS